MMKSHHFIRRELVTGILALVLITLALVLSAGPTGLTHVRSPLAAASHPVAPATMPMTASMPGARLTAIDFRTTRVGWVGGVGTILATTDGGHTWVRQYAGSETIKRFDFVTTAEGWALGTKALLHTTDGGRTWRPVGEPGRPLQQVDFVASTVGVGIAGTALHLEFVTSVVGWGIAGTTLYRTQDGGRTWQAQSTPLPIGGVCFVDQAHGWVVNAQQAPTAILSSADGGRTWHPTTLPPGTGGPTGYANGGGWAQTLRCARPRVLWDLFDFGGYAGGEGYALYRSADGGHHWRAIAQNQNVVKAAPGPAPLPGDLDVVDAATAYLSGACEACGNGMGTTAIGGTTDGGRTWRNLTIPGLPFTDFAAISFPTTQSGWMVAQWHIGPGKTRSALLATSDGGRTWVRHRV
jgi:photosystem II stability/assembly factor-like uncharacterized protein